jgi:hypothetical protein
MGIRRTKEEATGRMIVDKRKDPGPGRCGPAGKLEFVADI